MASTTGFLFRSQVVLGLFCFTEQGVTVLPIEPTGLPCGSPYVDDALSNGGSQMIAWSKALQRR